MSLSDTAEYWWDVKGWNRKPYSGPDFYHIPGHDCGHRHHYEAKYISEVNCHSCKKALAEGLEHNLHSVLFCSQDRHRTCIYFTFAKGNCYTH